MASARATARRGVTGLQIRYEIKSLACTGCIKKMSDSDFNLKSVPGVGFYFFKGVLDSEFRA